MLQANPTGYLVCFDRPNSSTTNTNPDVGGQHQIVVQSFDSYGKLITETMA